MVELSTQAKAQIDHWLAKFPADQRRSAVIMALRIAQDEHGYASDAVMDAVAAYLQIPATDVYEVASFYTMIRRKPGGQFRLNICTSISCHLCGAGGIVSYLEDKLGIKMGETTADGLFSLGEAECLAACCGAPMMQVNDQAYHENLTPEKLDNLLDELRAQAKQEAADV